jgi:hypothetical protein
MARLVDHYFLLVSVHYGDTDFAGHHDVCVAIRIADLVNALAGDEPFDFDLRGEHRGLFVIQQSEQRDMFQLFWVTSHGSPRSANRGNWNFERIPQLPPSDKAARLAIHVRLAAHSEQGQMERSKS